MCTNYLKTQFENNIRVMERKDFDETIKMISDNLYGLWLQNLKDCFRQNIKAQNILLAVTTGLMILLDGDICTFIFIIFAQESSLALAYMLKFYIGIENELKDLRHIGVASKKYIKFWILDGIINNQKQIVASVALTTTCDKDYDSTQTVELKRLSVTPNLRRMKIGSKMLEHALQKATEMGFQRMVLYCSDRQPPAIELYKRFGFKTFKIIDKTMFSVLSGVRLLYMEKDLH
ncbi:uncharacterized protein LOC120331391 [Styela clava]